MYIKRLTGTSVDFRFPHLTSPHYFSHRLLIPAFTTSSTSCLPRSFPPRPCFSLPPCSSRHSFSLRPWIAHPSLTVTPGGVCAISTFQTALSSPSIQQQSSTPARLHALPHSPASSMPHGKLLRGAGHATDSGKARFGQMSTLGG